jgi:hypothetical protein
MQLMKMVGEVEDIIIVSSLRREPMITEVLVVVPLCAVFDLISHQKMIYAISHHHVEMRLI